MAGAQKQTLNSEILPIWPYCGRSGVTRFWGNFRSRTR